MKIIGGNALTADGVSIDRYLEVDGTTFRAKAHGPSFYNGLGKFEVREVNGKGWLYGDIHQDGHVSVGYGQIVVRDGRIVVALGQLLTDDEFRSLVAAVVGTFAKRHATAA